MTKKNKTLLNYLTSIYGISNKKALKLCIYIGSDPNSLYLNLNPKKKNTLFKVLNYYYQSNQNNAIGKNLKLFKQSNISKKINNNSLAGRRFKLRLPNRGQRTTTNAKSAKRLNHF